ncbi:MAG: hypothetical protein IJP66_08685 [Kiritimatiellae bacterium]|nr:hypothetical protein [Kiritimatiellia bacterium]
MNAASALVAAVLVALAALAVWRNLRKGAPCECGGTRRCGHCATKQGGRANAAGDRRHAARGCPHCH